MNNDRQVSEFSIVIEVKPHYVVTVFAEGHQEARYEAYRRGVPVGKLYNIEKDIFKVLNVTELLKRQGERKCPPLKSKPNWEQ